MFVSCAIFEDSKRLWSYRDLNVSTALYILLVMRISIVILYLIVVHGYIEYKKRPPQWHFCTCMCFFFFFFFFVHSCNGFLSFFTLSHSVTHHILWQLLCSFTLAVKSSGVDGGSLAQMLDSQRVESLPRPACLPCPRTGRLVQHSSLYSLW